MRSINGLEIFNSGIKIGKQVYFIYLICATTIWKRKWFCL